MPRCPCRLAPAGGSLKGTRGVWFPSSLFVGIISRFPPPRQDMFCAVLREIAPRAPRTAGNGTGGGRGAGGAGKGMGRARRVGSGGLHGRGCRAGGAMRQDGRGDAAGEGGNGVDLRPNGSPLFRRAKDVMAAGVRGGTGRAVRMGGDGRGRERARARIAKARRMMYTFPMIRRKFRQKPYRRSLAASNAAPWLRLGALLLALAALGLLVPLVSPQDRSRGALACGQAGWSEGAALLLAPAARPARTKKSYDFDDLGDPAH